MFSLKHHIKTEHHELLMTFMPGPIRLSSVDIVSSTTESLVLELDLHTKRSETYTQYNQGLQQLFLFPGDSTLYTAISDKDFSILSLRRTGSWGEKWRSEATGGKYLLRWVLWKEMRRKDRQSFHIQEPNPPEIIGENRE